MEAVVTVSDTSQNHWPDRRVLVTGATGLVGGWVLERLLALRADPVCLLRDDVPRSRAARLGDLSRVTVVWGDLVDYPLLERVLNEYEIRSVIHLAAQTIVGTANRNPLSTFETNIRGTWNLLEAIRHTGLVESVVIASSDKAYGDAERLPYDESFPMAGSHPYDVSKSAADLIATAYHRTYRLPVTITRCGNFYGGGDLNFNRIVPGTIRSALRGERPIIRSDGSLRRDYIYVEDAARAYLLLAERTAQDAKLHGEAFNFSNEDPKSVLELVDSILRAAGRTDLEPIIQGRAPNEIKNQFLNSTKAKRVLGWSPLYTLEEGLERTVAWYRVFLDDPTGAETVLER
jgi:CDP-glucose 4,6-dehydratase